MTDVPEHLLRRSVERRAALSGQDAPAAVAPTGGASPAPTASSSAPAAPTTAAPSGPAFVEPVDRAAFARVAAVRRRRIPSWAMGVLAVLPLWGFLYVGAFGERPTHEEHAIDGASIYGGNCASCHGATGGGGVGPPLADGETLKTFPEAEPHIDWVKTGSSGKRGQPYGDPAREGGQRIATTGGMPGFEGQLSEEEIAAVVEYERGL